MKHFGLSLEEEKSRLIEFGRYAESNAHQKGEKADTFTFLGFTHYCSRSRNGKFRVKRKTSKKKFSKKCKETNKLIKELRHEPVGVIICKLNQILTGYFHYYGITDNFKGIKKFHYQVTKQLFYWLNQRSQKKSYTWEGFQEMLKNHPLEAPKIYVSIYA